MLKKLIKCNVKRHIRWGLNTGGVGFPQQLPMRYFLDPIDTVSLNLIKLVCKMVGMRIVYGKVEEINVTKNQSNQQIFDGSVTINDDNNDNLNVLVFNHNIDIDSVQSVMVNMSIFEINGGMNNDECNVTE